jgi:hypothetical protein
MRFGKELPLPDFWWEGRVGANQQPNIINPSNSPTNTFTRNSPKRVRNKNGILERVENNIPAFEYDENGNYLGYLPESLKENSWTQSNDLSVWSEVFSVDITQNGALRPNGSGIPSTRLTSTTTGTNVNRRRNFTTVIGQRYGFSVFMRKGNKDWNRIRIGSLSGSFVNQFIYVNLADGAIGATGTAENVKLIPYSNGWYRIEITYIALVTSEVIRFHTGYNADGEAGSETGDFVDYFGAQFELNGVSSYIEAGASTATRPADNLAFTDAQDFIGQSEGVIYAEVDVSSTDITRRLLTISDGTSGNRLQIFKAATTNGLCFLSTENGATRTALTSQQGSAKCLIRYINGNCTTFINGTEIGLIAYNFTELLTAIDIGNSEAQTAQANDPIRSVRIWKTADWCTDSIAQQMTAL